MKYFLAITIILQLFLYSCTKLREMIQNVEAPSEFILRPVVAKVIIDFEKPFVE